MKSLWLPFFISVTAVSLVFVFFEGLESQFKETLVSVQSHVKWYSGLSFGVRVPTYFFPFQAASFYI